MQERTKKLALAKTVIGQYEYKKRTYDVLYGGIFDVHQTGGQIVNLDKDEYSSMLTSFLLSEKGQEYLIPNQTQIVNDRDLLTRAEEVKKILTPYKKQKQDEDLNKAFKDLKIDISEEDKELNRKLNAKNKMPNLYPEDKKHIKSLEKWASLLSVLAIVLPFMAVAIGVFMGMTTDNLGYSVGLSLFIGVVLFFVLQVLSKCLTADAKTEKSSLDCAKAKVSSL